MSYNILIVDDSKSMRQILRKILAASGFDIGECLEASNGQDALSVLESNWVDVVLSDIHMPVIDGFGLLRALREHKDWSDLPVVLVTTESNEDRIQEAFSLGARGYIRKPFRPEEVRAHLCKVVGDSDGNGTAISDAESDF